MNFRKSIISIIILFGLTNHSFTQITFEVEHTKFILGPVNLSYSGWKYVDLHNIENNEIRLFNLDYTLFKELILPPKISNTTPVAVFYISETLFDTDSTTIEYFLGYIINDSKYYVRIANEYGEILLEEEDAVTYEIFTTEKYYYSIYETDHGTKMQLIYFNEMDYYKTKIFSLPGSYPTDIKQIDETNFSIFPNPSNGVNTIRLDPEINLKNGIINIFDTQGSIVKKLKINNNTREIHLDNSDLSSGVYFYQIISHDSFYVSQKKVLIVK